MKNKTLILSLLLITAGCSAPYHVKKASKHTAKALARGVVIPKDTVTVNHYDTITETYTKNDTTYIVKKVTNTVTLEPTIEIRTRRVDRWKTKYKFKEVKVENKAMIDSLKQVVKIERQNTKQTRAENRGFKWWWLLIAFALGFILNNLIRLAQIFKLTK